MSSPSRKQARAKLQLLQVACARRRPGRELGGNPWIARPAIPESFSRRLSCVKRSFAGFALAGLPLARSNRLRPKSQPRLSLIRQAALGGHPGKNILPRPCPAAAAACSTAAQGCCHFLFPRAVLLAFPTPETETLPGSTAKQAAATSSSARCPLARPAQLSALTAPAAFQRALFVPI